MGDHRAVDAPQFADLTGTLATFAVLGVVVVLVAAVAVPTRLRDLRDALGGYGPALATVVAGAAMAGSLWFSEVAHFPPCLLCWYQRIAMYPIAVLGLVAAVRRDRGFRTYGIVLAGIGLLISSYHIAVELYPSLESGSCDPTNPCSIRWVEGLGFWTIPRMAWAGFALAATCLWLDDSKSGELHAGS